VHAVVAMSDSSTSNPLRLMRPGQAESPCCNERIYASVAGRTWVGSCCHCGRVVCRVNPRTANAEWLNGAPSDSGQDAES
jgi:hypothetical protein